MTVKKTMNKTNYRELCKEFGIKPFPFSKEDTVKGIIMQTISLYDDFVENLKDELAIIIQNEELK